MATQPQTNLTYADLASFPEDNLRRELIGGELIVTAAPATRHQDVVSSLVIELGLYAREHGGKVFPAPTDVFLSGRTETLTSPGLPGFSIAVDEVLGEPE